MVRIADTGRVSPDEDLEFARGVAARLEHAQEENLAKFARFLASTPAGLADRVAISLRTWDLASEDDNDFSVSYEPEAHKLNEIGHI